MSTVLVVDDKDMLRDSVAATLQRAGFTVIGAGGGHAALELVSKRRPDAVVTDLRMPDLTGLELIEKVRELDEDLPVILMTAFATVETAVRAMKLGAFDYVTKPFEGDELIIAVKRALEHARLKRDNAVLRLAAGDRAAAVAGGGTAPGASLERRGLDRVIGDSPSIRAVKEQIATLAQSQGTVLISGESGTGKEVAARAIHEMSARAAEPFLAVNCAAMSESLLESELFGHEKGAFTGAEKLRKGRFELAHRGTLLLDEISEVRPQVQAKLLRVLQERTIERVGSSLSMAIDVRVIATTNRELNEEVRAGNFRGDLFFRLNVLPVHMPPLRERAQDVAQLAPHFVRAAAQRDGREPKEIPASTMELLMAYAWPGNVRELQNICERALVLCPGPSIPPDLIRGWLSSGVERGAAPAPARPHSTGTAPAQAHALNGAASVSEVKPLADIEREVIVHTLERFSGHRQKTAHALGIGVRTLGLKLKKWKEDGLVSEAL